MYAELPIITAPVQPTPRLIEVARSFSFKLNIGNFQQGTIRPQIGKFFQLVPDLFLAFIS